MKIEISMCKTARRIHGVDDSFNSQYQNYNCDTTIGATTRTTTTIISEIEQEAIVK